MTETFRCRIKKLEWKPDDAGRLFAVVFDGSEYVVGVRQKKRSAVALFRASGPKVWESVAGTQNQAQDLAEAHYEARVRSLLEIVEEE